MAVKHGRIEAEITVPAGGWDASVTGTSSGTATIPAGSYYPTTLAAEVATQFSSVTTDTVTCAISSGETGTGKTTLGTDGPSLGVTWTDTDLRDALGYDANVTTPGTYVSADHAQALWLPNCPMFAPYGPGDDGFEETDLRTTESPAGHVFALYGQRKIVLAGLRWEAVPKARARIKHESVTNESFQRFYRDCILGELSYVETNPKMRIYWDADAADYTTYRNSGGFKSFEPSLRLEDTLAYFTIRFDRLVKVP